MQIFCHDFSAPEILKKEYYGQEVDWWSLGVLACLLFTNEVRDKFLIQIYIQLSRNIALCVIVLSVRLAVSLH